MKAFILIGLIIASFNSFSQNSNEKIIKRFLNDIEKNNYQVVDLIGKYFKIDKSKDDKELLFKLLEEQIALITNEIKYCNELEILKHNVNNELIKSFKLNTDGLKLDNIYYITCNREIITPVLIENKKILSITAAIKHENAPKSFWIY